MAILPRPVHPRSALADLRDVLVARRAHKWPLLALSVTLTGLILWGFYLDSNPGITPEKQIIYVQNWESGRKDSDILVQQKIDLNAYEAALAKKQQEFQHVADRFGIEWRDEAERNRARRAAIVAAINRRLDQEIAQARAREAKAASDKPS
jgi:hypothetical protein